MPRPIACEPSPNRCCRLRPMARRRASAGPCSPRSMAPRTRLTRSSGCRPRRFERINRNAQRRRRIAHFADVRSALRCGESKTLAATQRAMNQPADPSDDILFDLRDGIGRVIFNRPQARNAFTFAMYDRLAAICRQANEDKAIKVLVFTGAGDKAFASGTDINQFRAFTTPQQAIEYEAHLDGVLSEIEECRVPTIAAITGACTGGGAGIAACCDLRIGTTTTRFGFPIARTLGNCLSLASLSRLSALIGPA